jgi:hypothetical protein
MLSVLHKRTALIASALSEGRAFLTSTAAPHTCGAAADVPLPTRSVVSLPNFGMTTETPCAVMSGKNRCESPKSGPREELIHTTLAASQAPTVSPFAVEELFSVDAPVFPAAVTGRTSAFSAHASSACWLTSRGIGLEEYDMLATTMLCRTLSAATRCQAAAWVDSDEAQFIEE